jgi:hypothetical protein
MYHHTPEEEAEIMNDYNHGGLTIDEKYLQFYSDSNEKYPRGPRIGFICSVCKRLHTNHRWSVPGKFSLKDGIPTCSRCQFEVDHHDDIVSGRLAMD